jgi:hypothetical protein
MEPSRIPLNTRGHLTLGDLAQDTITGFEGIVICVSTWLHGCRRLTLQPREIKDGKVVEPATFDEPQLQLVTKNVFDGSNDTGGPRPEPLKRQVER